VFFTQRYDLTGQRPYETNAVRRRAGNEVVVPTIRCSIYDCVFPIHAFKIPFLLSVINLIVAPNGAVAYQMRFLVLRRDETRGCPECPGEFTVKAELDLRKPQGYLLEDDTVTWKDIGLKDGVIYI
jgi:hypothetical protein